MKYLENLYLRIEIVRWGFNVEGRVPNTLLSDAGNF